MRIVELLGISLELPGVVRFEMPLGKDARSPKVKPAADHRGYLFSLAQRKRRGFRLRGPGKGSR